MTDKGATTRLLPVRILYTINSSPQYILARSHKPVPVSVIAQRSPTNSHYQQAVRDLPDAVTQNPSEERYATASLKICLDAICRSSPELVQDDSRDFSVYVLDPLESQFTPAPVNITDSSSVTNNGKPATAQPIATDQHPQGVAVGLGLMSWALLADEDDCVSVTGTLITGTNGHEALQVIFALRETVPMRKAALSSTVKAWGLPPPPSKRTRVHASKSHQSSKHPSSSKYATSSSFQSAHRPTSSQPQQPNTIYSKKQPATASSSDAQQPPASSYLLDSHSVYIGPPRRPVGRPDTGRGKAKANKKDTQPDSPLLVTTPLVRHDAANNLATKEPHSTPPTTDDEPPLVDLLAAISSSGQNAALLSALSAIDSSATASLVSDPHTLNPALVNALKQLLSMASPSPSSLSDDPASSKITTPPKAEKSQDDDIILLDKENVNPTAFRRRVDREDTKALATTTAGPGAGRAGLSLGTKENSSPTSTTRKRTLSEFMDERDREGDTRHNRSPSSHLRSYARPQTSPPRPVRMDENLTHRSVISTGSSPVRQRKRFVVPDWAKTETATLPRLSKETEDQAAMGLEGKGKKVTRKTGDGKRWRNARKKAPEDAPTKPDDAPETRSSHPGSQGSNETPTTPRSQVAEKALDPQSVLHQLPVFASDISVGSFPSSLPSPTSSPPASFEPPKTPTRKCLPHDKLSSLFTPTPKSSASSWPRGLLGDSSPLFNPGSRSIMGLVGQASPTRVVLSGKNVQESSDETLSLEPHDSSEDLEFPPSSLPTASSDVDIDENQDLDQDNAMHHWSGLPPSSPPPPSSPILLSQEDLPSDTLPSASGSHSDFDFSTDLASRENLEMSFDDFNGFFSDHGSQDFSPLDSSDGMIDAAVQNGVADFDFMEFWESVKPLVEGESGKAFGGQHDDSDMGGEIDHVKLAEEVQALFSGCLM